MNGKLFVLLIFAVVALVVVLIFVSESVTGDPVRRNPEPPPTPRAMLQRSL